MSGYTRVHRLLKIITLIQGGTGWTPERLAKECDVSERTIYRDLHELEGVGIGVTFDRASGSYRIPREFFLQPVELTAREALSLAVLCEQIAGREQIPFLNPANQAMAKILAVLPPGLRDEVRAGSGSIVVQTARTAPADGHEDMYDRVQHAIAERRALRCRYDSLSGSGEDETFIFRPYALYFAVRAWYAVGFHGGRGEVRTLKLSRFSMAAPTDEAYEIPDGFSLDQMLGNAWRMIPGERDYAVELRFSPDFAETISEVLWHRTQSLEHHHDGSLTFRCTVSGLGEIQWWVLSMGPHCEVIAPRELRDLVKGKALATAAMYVREDGVEPGPPRADA